MNRVHPSEVVFTFRPIASWTHGNGQPRTNSPFRVTEGKIQAGLKTELATLGVSRAVIQADIEESDLRIDGLPRASARFRSGRVILSFTHPNAGPLSYPCGRFADLWANIRAITLTLQALRAVDRYGVTRGSEQYTGWKQLPPSGTAIVLADFASVEDAARFLLRTAGASISMGDVDAVVRQADRLSMIYRLASKVTHPDAGGSEHAMARVNAARDFIEKCGGGR